MYNRVDAGRNRKVLLRLLLFEIRVTYSLGRQFGLERGGVMGDALYPIGMGEKNQMYRTGAQSGEYIGQELGRCPCNLGDGRPGSHKAGDRDV